jgi:Ni,Fe-hydrogenase I cytochrome b subunit
MNHDARLMSGILLITVPTIQYGGYFLLRLFSGQMPQMKPSPLQISFFRAGHAHAGVLVILSLLCQIFVEHAALAPAYVWFVRIGVPLAAILIPLGFFLSVAFTPDRPNKWILALYAGAVVLAISVVMLGVGLMLA